MSSESISDYSGAFLRSADVHLFRPSTCYMFM